MYLFLKILCLWGVADLFMLSILCCMFYAETCVLKNFNKKVCADNVVLKSCALNVVPNIFSKHLILKMFCP